MPIFTLRNNETEEEYDVIMSYDKLQSHLSENTHIERLWTTSPYKPHTGDVRHQFEKKGPPKAFNNHLKNIAKSYPRSTVNYW